MGPTTWTVVAVSFLVASYGLWLIWREIMDEPT
jgi:ABC-type nickel/cobalt efflux system permease component RcnA